MSDSITDEIGNVAFGVDKTYKWQIIDFLDTANKLVYQCLDKLLEENINVRLAVRKLRTRVTQAT